MGPDETPHTVVGVVGDVRLDGALAPAVPLAYVPLFQRTTETIFDNLGLTIGLRRRGASGEREHPVPRAVRALDAEMPIEPPEAIDSLIRDSLPLESMLQHLSLIAVTLTLITLSLGLYATASQLAAERAREFGVRLALGARPADLALTVLRWCAVTLGAGLIIGLLIVRALAVPFARAQQLSLTVDALVVGTVSRVVLAVGLAAVGSTSLACTAHGSRRLTPPSDRGELSRERSPAAGVPTRCEAVVVGAAGAGLAAPRVRRA